MVRGGRSENPDSKRAPAGVVSPCIRMKPDDEEGRCLLWIVTDNNREPWH